MSTDEHVVSLKFDNKQFEAGVAETIKSINALKDSLDFSKSLSSFAELTSAADKIDLSNVSVGLDGVTKATDSLDLSPVSASFDGLTKASDSVDLSGISNSLDHISSKFSTLGAVGFSVIQNLTSGIMGFASNMLDIGKTDILGPILTGGKKRAMNIEQAKFMFEGLGIDVQKGMDSALSAVLGTAYGLDEAAKAAAQFGASGIKVGDEMTGALRGVAGAAAMTGSSFTEMADIFAGSAGSGFVNNMDLMQFSTRGLNAAAAIAPILHTTEAGVHELATNGELDFKTFAHAMDQAFGKHATEANKTYAGSLSNLHAAMSRLGAAFIAPKLEQERQVFNAMSPAIDRFKTSLAPLIDMFQFLEFISAQHLVTFINALDFTNVGAGLTNLAELIKVAFLDVQYIFTAIRVAFQDIFPPKATSSFLSFTEKIKQFADGLLIGGVQLEKFRQIFAGFFAILDIGWAILKGVFGLIFDVFKTLLPAVKGGSGGLLDFAVVLAKAAQRLDAFLVKGNRIGNFFALLARAIVIPIQALEHFISSLTKTIIASEAFDKLGKAIQKPLASLKAFGDAVTETLFKPFGKTSPIRDELDRIEHREGQVAQGFSNFGDFVDGVITLMGKAVDRIAFYTSDIRDKLAHLWGPQDFKPALDAVNTGLFAGLIVLLYNLLKPGLLRKIAKMFGINFLGQIGDNIDKLTKSLTGLVNAFTKKIKVDTLMQVAKSVALLTVAIIALATMDSASLSRSIGAIAILMGTLVGALVLLDKNVGGNKLAGLTGNGLKDTASTVGKLYGLSSVLKAMGVAILLLAVALRTVGTLEPAQVAAGLAGLLGLMAGMVGVFKLLNKLTANPGAGRFIKDAAEAMLIMSIALIALAAAIKIFSTMSWKTFGNGLTKVVIGLALLVGALNLMPENAHIMAAAIAIGILSVSMALMAATIIGYNRIPWKTLVGGVLKVAIAIGFLSLSLNLMPNEGKLLAGAAALFILSFALQRIAKAVQLLGMMKFGDVAKGVGALAIMLGLLTLAVIVFADPEILLGVAGILGTSFALEILAKAIAILGAVPITQLVIGIAAFVAVMLLLGAIAVGAAVIAPALAILGATLLAVAASVLLFGAGVFLLAAGLSMLSRTGVKGAEALAKVIQTLVIIAISLVQAVGNILNTLMDELVKLIPKGAKLVVTFMFAIIEAIMKNLPKFVSVGVEMFVKLVEGFLKYRELFVDAVIALIIGLADTIHKKSGKVFQAFLLLGFAFVDVMLGTIVDHIPFLGGKIKDMFKGMNEDAEKAFKAASPSKLFSDLGKSLSDGISNSMDKDTKAEDSSGDWADRITESFSKGISGLVKMPELNDIQPTVTPTMDLSQINSGMDQMNQMFADNQDLNANVSTDQANQISSDTQGQAHDTSSNQTTQPSVSFTQNNYSPTALSTDDIYRQTKSQLALAKEDLSI